MKNYVARAFENLPEGEKNEVEKELKDIITDAFDKDIVWKIDWDNMELPQDRIKIRKMHGQVNGDIVMKDVEEEVNKVEGGLRKAKTNNLDGVTTSSSSSVTASPTQTPPRQTFSIDNSYAVSGSKKRKRFCIFLRLYEHSTDYSLAFLVPTTSQGHQQRQIDVLVSLGLRTRTHMGMTGLLGLRICGISGQKGSLKSSVPTLIFHLGKRTKNHSTPPLKLTWKPKDL